MRSGAVVLILLAGRCGVVSSFSPRSSESEKLNFRLTLSLLLFEASFTSRDRKSEYICSPGKPLFYTQLLMYDRSCCLKRSSSSSNFRAVVTVEQKTV